MEETEMHIVSERSQFEKVTNFMIPTILNSGSQNYGGCKKDQWLPGVVERKKIGANRLV